MNDRRISGDRRDVNENTELEHDIVKSIEELPPNPSASDVEKALRAFRKEYATFAKRNADRLDGINHDYRRLIRKLIVVGMLVAAAQLGLGLFGVKLQIKATNAATAAHTAVTRVQEGRRDSLSVTCVVQSAIAQVGRGVIAGPSTPPPAAQERALEKFGFPPFEVRHAQQLAAADAYVKSISQQIDSKIGKKGDKLINPNGTINCKRLATIAKIPGA